jgi:hypothetical protein
MRGKFIHAHGEAASGYTGRADKLKLFECKGEHRRARAVSRLSKKMALTRLVWFTGQSMSARALYSGCVSPSLDPKLMLTHLALTGMAELTQKGMVVDMKVRKRTCERGTKM